MEAPKHYRHGHGSMMVIVVIMVIIAGVAVTRYSILDSWLCAIREQRTSVSAMATGQPASQPASCYRGSGFLRVLRRTRGPCFMPSPAVTVTVSSLTACAFLFMIYLNSPSRTTCSKSSSLDRSLELLHLWTTDRPTDQAYMFTE